MVESWNPTMFIVVDMHINQLGQPVGIDSLASWGGSKKEKEKKRSTDEVGVVQKMLHL